MEFYLLSEKIRVVSVKGTFTPQYKAYNQWFFYWFKGMPVEHDSLYESMKYLCCI